MVPLHGSGSLVLRFRFRCFLVIVGAELTPVCLTDMWENSSSSSWCVSTRDLYLFFSFFLVYLLLLPPLLLFIIYLGFQRWRRGRSSSHSDVFTYNMVVMETGSLLGLVMFSSYSGDVLVTAAGIITYSTSSCGQTLFHLLTCLDRYLAVVHPITYLRLRQRDGLRNVSIACVWLLAVVLLTSTFIQPSSFILVFSLLLLLLSSSVVFFCSVSVLRVLTAPGPGPGPGGGGGGGGGDGGRVDQVKQRAFYTIVAIMLALFLRFWSLLVVVVLCLTLMADDVCFLIWTSSWFSLPSSLVLPLLFLHRSAHLPSCCCHL